MASGAVSVFDSRRTTPYEGESYIRPHGSKFLLLFVVAVALFAVACSSESDIEPTPVADAALLTAVPSATFAAISTPVSASLPLDTGVTVNRIAYVTSEFEVFTVSPDGSDPIRVTPDPEPHPGYRYLWPFWFPSGDRILVSRIQPPDAFGARVALVSITADGSDTEPVVIFEDDPVTNGIGGGAPHYTHFSPDGRWLAAVVGTQNGLVLSVFDMTDPRSSRVKRTDLTTGAPIYYDWSYHSSKLVLHYGGNMLTYENAIDGELSESAPDAPPIFFSPALSPIKDLTAAVLELPGGSELRLVGLDGGYITDTPAEAQFAWSPDGTKLVLLRQMSRALPIGLFDELAVIGISSNGEPTERILQFNRPMRSVWWAPDSGRVELSSVDTSDSRKVRWDVIDIESGDSVHVANMVHSPDFEFVQSFHGQ